MKKMPSARELKKQQHENYDQRVNKILSGETPYKAFEGSRFPSPKCALKHPKITFS